MLPERIKLKVEGCDGVANAFFFRGDVKICYEYFDYLMKYAPKMAREGLSIRDAMIGPVVDVFLHEVGHVVVEVLDIPYFAARKMLPTISPLTFCCSSARTTHAASSL